MGEEIERLSAQIAQLTSIVLAQQKTAQQGGFLTHNKGGTEEMSYHVPKGCTLFQRKDDLRWVAKIMVDGKQQPVACRKSKKYVYDQMMKAHRANKKTKTKKDKEFTLFSWLDHWHDVYRKPKEGTELSKNTLISDISMIKKIKKVFKDCRLRDLTADVVQQKLYAMPETRTCEGVYTVLKLALDKAKDRTGGVSIMTLVEKVKHERKRGRDLKPNEINTLLGEAKNEEERQVIHFYINTGCRVDEISATLVEYVNLTNETRMITGLTDLYGKSVPDMTLLPGEILIHGTKTKGSLRTMPIMPPLKPILEKLTKDKNGNPRKGKEKLFRYSTAMIRFFHRDIKQRLKDKGTPISFTLKDYRHTAATNFKDAGIPSSVYFRWFGWCDDTMAKRVYTHETDYEKKLSLEWAQKFSRVLEPIACDNLAPKIFSDKKGNHEKSK